MKKYCFILPLLLFNTLSALWAQQLTFQKNIGGPNWEYAYAIQKTADSGYILGGVTSSFGAGGSSFDQYVVRLTAAGDTVWTRTYGGSCATPEVVNDIYPTTDGGFVFTGYTGCWGVGVNAYIIRIKGNGDTLWTKSWGGPLGDDGYGIIQSSDGGILITGNESSYGAGMLDAMFIKLNSNGDTIWSKTFGGPQDDWGYALQQTTDGGYVIGGYTKSFGAGGKDAYLIKTNAAGFIQWSKTYGGSGDDEGYGHCIQQTADGGYILVGSSTSFGAGGEDVYLIKTDASGNLQWSRTYGGTKDDFGHAVRQTADKGFIVTGFTKSFGNGGTTCNNAFLLKTNSGGDLLWAHTYGGDGKGATGGTSADGGYGLVIANDGGYVITGITNSYGANPNDEDMYILKTDSLGNTNCMNQTNPTFLVGTPATVAGSPATITSYGGQTQTTGTIVRSGGISHTICFTPASNLSVASGEILNNISFYPNPAGDRIFVRIPEQTDPYALVITDNIGVVRYRFDCLAHTSQVQSIPVSNWVPGSYILIFSSLNQRSVYKLVIGK
ncbi:MAG: T9SS type A sorting domain-containing protein [Taibaiella sp.]|nr:T9SS type A sorting domain-containing protein [Taibaiella sp.]